MSQRSRDGLAFILFMLFFIVLSTCISFAVHFIMKGMP